MSKGAYTKAGRLSDVIALIQVLALDQATHRSQAGITMELQEVPESADSWMALAQEHREFFRIDTEAEHGLSLVARHVLPREQGRRPPLSPDFTGTLVQTAITLHDRQVNAADWWKSLVPLWAALIGGVFGTASTLITIWFKGCPK